MPKRFVQLDHEGFFIGQETAFESPLEQGKYLMPAGCIDATAPTNIPTGKRARWTGSAWALEYAPGQSPAEILEASKQTASSATAALTNTARERIAKASHYLQASGWPVKLAAAQDVLANGEQSAQPLHVQMLALEARLRGRGETLESLAALVIANSRMFTLVGAAIDGIETATLDAINDPALTTTPQALTALTDQAALDLQVELAAIFGECLGLAPEPAQAAVAAILAGD